MTRLLPLIVLLTLLMSLVAIAAEAPIVPDDAALIKAKAALLFADDFDRVEADPAKEDLGPGWSSNSARRAKGQKQVALTDGVMKITRAEIADHGVAIFHDVDFQDGAVELKFKLRPGDDLGVDFVDRQLKTVHAGHLCIARVTNQRLTLSDSKTGVMDLKIYERRKAGDKSPELAKFLKTKTAAFKLDLDPEAWHTMLIVIEGDQMRATIDGRPVGQFRSEGIAHPTKRMITLAVNKSAEVDDVKAWRLK
jgi:hypothetical protein